MNKLFAIFLVSLLIVSGANSEDSGANSEDSGANSEDSGANSENSDAIPTVFVEVTGNNAKDFDASLHYRHDVNLGNGHSIHPYFETSGGPGRQQRTRFGANYKIRF